MMLVSCGVQACKTQHSSNQNFEGLRFRGSWLLSAVGWGQKEHNTVPQKSNRWCSELREPRHSARSQGGEWSLVASAVLQLPPFFVFWACKDIPRSRFHLLGMRSMGNKTGLRTGKTGILSQLCHQLSGKST